MNSIATPVTNRFPLQLAGCCFILLLVLNLPGFLCMGLDCDTYAFDLYLHGMQEGKVLYRDMIENNLPGVMWVHGITRSLFGWSSVAMRAVDITLIGGAILLLCCWQRGISITARIWIGFFLLSFYFTTSEWVHCQRDPWLLLPAMGALFLRRNQLEQVQEGKRSGGGSLALAMLEGILWGLALWLKPYAMVPGVIVWLIGVTWWRKSGTVRFRDYLFDFGGLLLGGVICGAMGILWMKSQGCWEPYVQHISSMGNDYVAADMYRPFTKTEHRLFQILRFYPWSLLAIGTIFFGIWYLSRAVFVKVKTGDRGHLSSCLFVGMLLGFFGESVFLQHVFDYALIPFFFLSLTWIANRIASTKVPREQLLLGTLCGITVFMGLVPVLKNRLPVWEKCLTEGPSWEVKDRLNILGRIQWQNLKRVRDFLIAQGIQPGELTAFHESALPLYEEFGFRPPTRSYMMTNQLFTFPSRREALFNELSASKQRFAVMTTLLQKVDRQNLDEEPADEHQPLPDCWRTPYDWTQHVAFRAGNYVVLELPGSMMSDWCRDCLGF